MQTKAKVFDQKKRIFALWVLSGLFLLAAVLVKPYWSDGGIHEAVEVSGLVLVFFAILGRLWSILYIGAHKNRRLIQQGPYSMTRNPLYVSSLLGIFGVGLMCGSFILAAAMTAAFYVAFRYAAEREAAYLHGAFGQAYADYARRTPLFLPDPRLYERSATVKFSQKALASTFRDSLFLLALFPLIEGIEYLRANSYLPVALTLL